MAFWRRGSGWASSPGAAFRGWRLPLSTDRHHSHRGGPQGGGPARTDPGGAAARAGAEEEGGPAVRTPPPRRGSSPSRPHCCRQRPRARGSPSSWPHPRRSGPRDCGLWAARWPRLVPMPSLPHWPLVPRPDPSFGLHESLWTSGKSGEPCVWVSGSLQPVPRDRGASRPQVPREGWRAVSTALGCKAPSPSLEVEAT